MNWPMSQSSVSRCIDKVPNILIDLFNGKVEFLREHEKVQESDKFFIWMNGFPSRQHITFRSLVEDRTRRNWWQTQISQEFYSLIQEISTVFNFQIICGADLRINLSYPGSSHVAEIEATSLIRNHWVDNINNDRFSWLLGDSGYPLEPWLMVPIHPGSSLEWAIIKFQQWIEKNSKCCGKSVRNIRDVLPLFFTSCSTLLTT